jgi:predicted ester cyclase
MTANDYKELLQRYYEGVWNRGDLSLSDELISPTEVQHTHGTLGPGGPHYDRTAARAFRAAFPDVRFTIEVMVDGGELIAVLWRAQGTHADTGRPLRDYTGVNIFRIADGKVVEVWNTRDDLGLFAQLELIPPRSQLVPKVFSL